MNRVAIVTGAARGIGAATVRSLAQAGYCVTAVDRCSDDPRLPYAMGSRKQLRAVVEEANDVAGAERVVAAVVDASVASALSAVVDATEQRWGGVDVVVAAAGVIAGGVPQWQVPEDQERAVLDACLGGVLVAARVGVPALLRRPEPRAGRYIAIASAAATRGLPMLAAYCAAKAGVVGMVNGLALELRGTGVTANALSPGSTATAILDESARLYGLEDPEQFAVQQPLQRLIAPEEIAAMVVWLAGPGGGVVTGANLAVDGGLSV